MNNKIELFTKIRGIITFITEEIEKIPTSQKTKEQVLNICDAISTKALHNIGEIDDEEIIAEIYRQLEKFDILIKVLENNEDEKIAYMLLITHIADIFSLIGKERQK